MRVSNRSIWRMISSQYINLWRSTLLGYFIAFEMNMNCYLYLAYMYWMPQVRNREERLVTSPLHWHLHKCERLTGNRLSDFLTRGGLTCAVCTPWPLGAWFILPLLRVWLEDASVRVITGSRALSRKSSTVTFFIVFYIFLWTFWRRLCEAQTAPIMPARSYFP